MKTLVDAAVRYPRRVFVVVALLVAGLGSQIPRIVIDTDPENMLPADQPARVFHNQVKKDFGLSDLIVVGMVDERDQDGVFHPRALAHLHEVTERITRIEGVVQADLMSLSTVDNVSQGAPGEVRFEWLMNEPPETREEALAIRDAAKRIPTLDGTLVSEDGKAAAIYVPIVDKSESYRIATEIEKIVEEVGGSEQWFVTGLPVAEDTFGVEMFMQMAISAPAAALVIFLVMWFFFRSFTLVLSAMVVAMATVIATMGMLIGAGFTVHIMSSMIPIFLMPIAVVDSVHILSEFADSYRKHDSRIGAVKEVMSHLFKPMLYTSLTSAAGFLSLALTPIPPVRVFGVFVAVGIGLAFLITVTFVPAYVVVLSPKRIERLRVEKQEGEGGLARALRKMGVGALAMSKPIVVVAALVVVGSIWGISRIQINDNPVRWFRSSHQIRIADRVLNEHFGGTYNAFLALEHTGDRTPEQIMSREVAGVLESARKRGVDLRAEWKKLTAAAAGQAEDERLRALARSVEERLDAADDDRADVWDEVLARIEEASSGVGFFRTPGGLMFIETLQRELDASGLVGKSGSLADIVKTVHRELRGGEQAHFTIPETRPAVAQVLLSYQSSHRPHDLLHMATPDYGKANIWLQLRSGDNQDMTRVREHVDRFLAANPPPKGVNVGWAGLTYLNVVWQDEMVAGMRDALLGGFVVVFVMMVVLFRSLVFGAFAMLPLGVTITLAYGLIGLVGKDYDMPIAVLSSLTLGLSIDFAIHFLERARDIQRQLGDWRKTMQEMFGEPGRAIARNALVIAIGFLPLLLAPLIPYNTVGVFLAAIMAVSCTVTLGLLPGALNLTQRWLPARVPVHGGKNA